MVLQPCSKPLHCSDSGIFLSSFTVSFESSRLWNKPEKAHFFITNIQTLSCLFLAPFESTPLSVSLQPWFVLTFRLISGSNILDVSMLNSAMPLASVVKLFVFLWLTNSWITSLEIGELSLSTSLICRKECKACSVSYLSVGRYSRSALLWSPQSRTAFSSSFKEVCKNWNVSLCLLASTSWGSEQELPQHLLHHWECPFVKQELTSHLCPGQSLLTRHFQFKDILPFLHFPPRILECVLFIFLVSEGLFKIFDLKTFVLIAFLVLFPLSLLFMC